MAVSTGTRRSGDSLVPHCLRHRGWLPTWLFWPALLALAVMVGCGGSDEPPEQAEPPVEETAQEPEEPEVVEAEPVEVAKPEPTPVVPDEPPEPKVPRPENVADWAETDFIGAKQDRDPRLIEAVAFLAEQGTGDNQAANLLARLLVTPEAPEPDPSMQPEPEPEPPPAKPVARSSDDDDDDSYDDDDDDDDNDDSYDDDDDDNDDSYDDDDDDDDSYDDDDDDDGGMSDQESVMPLPGVAILEPRYVSLPGAIVRSLGANGTEASRGVLKQILSGSIDTGCDRVTTSAALKALVDNRCLENEVILFGALTNPEAMRPEEQGQVTAEQLRESVFAVIGEAGSPRLRWELARYLFTASPPPEFGDRLTGFLTSSHPYNVQSQTSIYRHPNTDDTLKQKFQGYLAAYSATALARLLGVSSPQAEQADAVVAANTAQPRPNADDDDDDDDDDNAADADAAADDDDDDDDDYSNRRPTARAPRSDPGSSQDNPIESDKWGSESQEPADVESVAAFGRVEQSDFDLPRQLGAEIWGPTFSGVVVGEMGSAESIGSHGALLNLATTIPTDRVRSALYATLQAHWEEGPGPLKQAAVLPAEGTIDPGFLPLVKTLVRKTPGKIETKDAWISSSLGLVLYLFDRLGAVGGGEGTDPVELTEELPFKLPNEAAVTSVYRRDWQQEVAANMSGVPADRLLVCYVRFDVFTRYSRMLAFYKTNLKSVGIRDIPQGTWLDNYGIGSQPDSRRSIDVIITRQPGNTDPRSPDDESLTVEIVSVEIKSPEPAIAPAAGN